MAAESTQADFVGQEAPYGPDDASLKDIGSLAVWSLSGAKPGNGVDQLLDGDVRSFLAVFESSPPVGWDSPCATTALCRARRIGSLMASRRT